MNLGLIAAAALPATSGRIRPYADFHEFRCVA